MNSLARALQEEISALCAYVEVLHDTFRERPYRDRIAMLKERLDAMEKKEGPDPKVQKLVVAKGTPVQKGQVMFSSVKTSTLNKLERLLESEDDFELAYMLDQLSSFSWKLIDEAKVEREKKEVQKLVVAEGTLSQKGQLMLSSTKASTLTQDATLIDHPPSISWKISDEAALDAKGAHAVNLDKGTDTIMAKIMENSQLNVEASTKVITKQTFLTAVRSHNSLIMELLEELAKLKMDVVRLKILLNVEGTQAPTELGK